MTDMIDHLTLKVRDIQASIDFYSKALAPLGYVAKAHHEPTIGFGAEDDGAHSDFYLTPRGDKTGSPVTHIAFRAADAATVDAFYRRRSLPVAATMVLQGCGIIMRSTIRPSSWIRTGTMSKQWWTGQGSRGDCVSPHTRSCRHLGGWESLG